MVTKLNASLIELAKKDTTVTVKSASKLILYLEIYNKGQLRSNFDNNSNDFRLQILDLAFIHVISISIG